MSCVFNRSNLKYAYADCMSVVTVFFSACERYCFYFSLFLIHLDIFYPIVFICVFLLLLLLFIILHSYNLGSNTDKKEKSVTRFLQKCVYRTRIAFCKPDLIGIYSNTPSLAQKRIIMMIIMIKMIK